MLTCGGKSDTVSPSLLADIGSPIVDLVVEVFDDASHFLPMEEPEATAASIRDLLTWNVNG